MSIFISVCHMRQRFKVIHEKRIPLSFWIHLMARSFSLWSRRCGFPLGSTFHYKPKAIALATSTPAACTFQLLQEQPDYMNKLVRYFDCVSLLSTSITQFVCDRNDQFWYHACVRCCVRACVCVFWRRPKERIGSEPTNMLVCHL